jgi:hypothetical protein
MTTSLDATVNNKRIFAFLSLGLLLAAVLVPIAIAAFGRLEFAFSFGVVAGLLAVLFGALSWSDHIGRAVTIAALLVVVVGGGSYSILSQKWRTESQSATVVESTQPESEGQR